MGFSTDSLYVETEALDYLKTYQQEEKK